MSKRPMGLDGISARFLKTASSVMYRPLFTIINLSIQTGKFPTKLKQSKVTPIYKKGQNSDKNNYRPISFLKYLKSTYLTI
jgi:hypothetical protein